jgi:hypothetical protein
MQVFTGENPARTTSFCSSERNLGTLLPEPQLKTECRHRPTNQSPSQAFPNLDQTCKAEYGHSLVRHFDNLGYGL